MKVLKIDDDDLTQACENLKAANAALASANKTAKGAKATISQKLKELRDVDIGALPIGELVSIDKLLLIEIGKQHRFDERQYSLDRPDEFEAYQKDFPVVKYKPLV